MTTHHETHACCHSSEGGSKAEKNAIDPICGMTVNPETTELKSTYQGETYHFCSSRCLSKFDADPRQALAQSGPQSHPVIGVEDDTTLYTCPMHPEIQQQGPGPCPLCGKALEPMTISLDD